MKPNIVAITTDAALFPPAAFLATRLARLNPRDDTEIIVFSDAFEMLSQGFQFGVPADLRHIQLEALPTVPKDAAHLSTAAFFRYLLPEMTAPEVRRILYLDADVYPESADLFRLFDLDLRGHAIAAVRDLNTAYGGFAQAGLEMERAGAGRKFLNSGVLLIDRERYIANRLRGTILRAGIEQRYHDQWAANVALRGGWLELSPAMNMPTRVVNSFVGGIVKPVVTHFMGPEKPWHGPRFPEDHRARGEIEQYLLSSPWKRFLSAQFDFKQAWGQLRAAPAMKPGAPKKAVLPPATDLDGIRAYLYETAFADVEQGITPPIVQPA